MDERPSRGESGINSPTLTIAVFEITCQEWPTHEVTLRDRARVVWKRELPPRNASEASSSASP